MESPLHDLSYEDNSITGRQEQVFNEQEYSLQHLPSLVQEPGRQEQKQEVVIKPVVALTPDKEHFAKTLSTKTINILSCVQMVLCFVTLISLLTCYILKPYERYVRTLRSTVFYSNPVVSDGVFVYQDEILAISYYDTKNQAF